MRRLRTAGLVAIGTFMFLLLGVGAAWALDGHAHDGRVARNVALAGRDIGGMKRSELDAAVERLASSYPSTAVRVEAGASRFKTTAGELGVAIDKRATADAAMRVGKGGALPGRVVSWIGSFLRDRHVKPRVDVDRGTVAATVARFDSGPKDEPVEPSIAYRKSKFAVVPGKAGTGIDPRKVIALIPDAVGSGGPFTIHTKRGAVPPRFSKERAAELAEEAARVTRTGLPVRAGAASATVPVSQLRSWLTTRAGSSDLELAVDPDRALSDLAKLLPRAGTPPVDAGFQVTSSGIVITASKSGTKCCAASATERIIAALADRPSKPLELALIVAEPKRDEDDARKLGIKEQVSTFTTPHKCCEARVKNIHRIADLTRGHVIEPGTTFSVNDFIGKRTAAKGFVKAPVIENGQHSDDIGGGISPFATTIFNAAFFAGLEFGEYQSHSLYISRYPYGREATMGYPHPDLQLKNITPHGILIWPTYSSTRLTVTFYSTKYFKSVVQSKQTKSAQGTCTVVRTERTRTHSDGDTKVDNVTARYRADEGLNCDGSRAPPPAGATTTRPKTTTTTGAGGSPTTTAPRSGTTSPPTSGPPPTSPPASTSPPTTQKP